MGAGKEQYPHLLHSMWRAGPSQQELHVDAEMEEDSSQVRSLKGKKHLITQTSNLPLGREYGKYFYVPIVLEGG